MPRYVDVEVIEAALLAEKNRDRSKAYGTHECDLIAHVYESAKQLCRVIPTADVEPVRRGRWIFSKDEGDIYLKCSECEDTYHFECVANGTPELPEINCLCPYCPNCGAKMDGSEVEDDGEG